MTAIPHAGSVRHSSSVIRHFLLPPPPPAKSLRSFDSVPSRLRPHGTPFRMTEKGGARELRRGHPLRREQHGAAGGGAGLCARGPEPGDRRGVAELRRAGGGGNAVAEPAGGRSEQAADAVGMGGARGLRGGGGAHFPVADFHRARRGAREHGNQGPLAQQPWRPLAAPHLHQFPRERGVVLAGQSHLHRRPADLPDRRGPLQQPAHARRRGSAAGAHLDRAGG